MSKVGLFTICILFVLAGDATGSLASAAADLRARIDEYDLPTPDSHPHDPAHAPDGSFWYTAQRANKLGRLDPRTGQIREYPLRTPDSGPHGIVADKRGNIWFTAHSAGYIGKLEPKTGSVTEYPILDPRARDPHTPVFDPTGMLWFTVENGSFVGRLDPATGKIELRTPPSDHAAPYGIVVGPGGMPYFCEFGTNKLGSIDPKTLEIREYSLPEGARPRRLAVAPDGSIYYSDFARGYLGRFVPATGKIDEWASPGGASSRPYGIAVTRDGEVWYSESGVSPNTIVRFDPTTQTFAVRAIPSGGGVVRNIVATPDGRLYLACSGVNKVAIVHPTLPTARLQP
jgi:virginiamycin B lyase